MSKLSTKDISASITGGYVHIILPDLGEPTGWKSYRIKLEDFTTGGSGTPEIESYANYAALPATGEADIIYITLDDYKLYGYYSSAYHELSPGGGLDETAHDLLDHSGLTGIPSISGLLDETAHDALDHTGLTGVGTGDMTLSGVQSVTGLKTFDTTKAAIKGSSTGINKLASANASATDYTNTFPAKTMTIAGTDDIAGIVYCLGVALAQLDTDIEVATGVAKFPFPEDATLTQVFIRLSTAPTGSSVIYDINASGSSILTNKITIDATEYNSLDAATQPTFSDTNIDEGEAITIDCDQIGATVAGQNPVLIINYTKR